MKNKIFLDTAYAIALSSSKDQYHERAVSLAERLEKARTSLVTTRSVHLEIGNALPKQRHRQLTHSEIARSLQCPRRWRFDHVVIEGDQG